jgi:hypothetical protein
MIDLEILSGKCDFKNIPSSKLEDLFHKKRTEDVERYWDCGPTHQLNDLPDFEEVLQELQELMENTSRGQ